ncbi:hypothetical protein, partial [Xanthomonas euvesicatoria]|uniref:hypothetical protein n=1 Tax=Xanthomonas euvesicatoria TaxID=456327 RepID=UPI0026E1A810
YHTIICGRWFWGSALRGGGSIVFGGGGGGAGGGGGPPPPPPGHASPHPSAGVPQRTACSN